MPNTLCFLFVYLPCSRILTNHPVQAKQHRNILNEMSKKPNSINKSKGLFLAAAGISFLLSIALWFTGSKEQGLYVGIWVPSICSAGSLILAGGRNG